MSDLKRVLFIAYNFPPCGGPSVQRSLKFVKYLPNLGWQPVVISTEPTAHPVQDTSLERDIPPGTPIYRSPSWDVNAWRPIFAKFKLGKVLALFNTLLALPDSTLAWAKAAQPIVKRAIEMHQPQTVYTTSGPYSAHLLGLWIKKNLDLPWVADFRDPWSQNRLVRYPPGYRAINQYMERRVLQTADHIVTVSKPIAKSLHELSRSDTPVSVIPNGYDPDDVPLLAPVQTPRLTITYTGKFTRLRRPDALVEAVTRLIDARQIPSDEIELNFAGDDMGRYIPARPPFANLGYLPHSELPALWRRSNILLLVQDPSPENLGDYSGKIFEYLAANRPVLAITNPATVAADLIRQSNSGWVVDHDPESIQLALLEYYRRWKSGQISHLPNWDVIRRFSRRELTAQLVDILERMSVDKS